MEKANIHKASAIYYLSNQFSLNPDAADKKALFVNHFLMNNNVKCNLYFILCSTDLQSFMRLKISDEVLVKTKGLVSQEAMNIAYQ